MFTRPAELADERIVAVLAAGWGLAADDVEYLPVGFGSHHWRAEGDGRCWFVTVDDLAAKRWANDEPLDAGFERLGAAITTARELRDAGLAFVVAPERTADGGVLCRLDGFAVALYAQVEGRTHDYGRYTSDDDRLAVLELLVRLHAAPTAGPTWVDDFELRNRADLDRALGELDRPWDTGPYAEPCRAALAAHRGEVRRRLAVYDGLAARARAHPERTVVTHGEPHPGNTILTADGWVLVDWDTVLLAPPERDIWEMAREDPSVPDRYTAATGTAVDRDALELYRLGWDLAEVAIYTALLRATHEATEDIDKSWGHLQGYLEQLASE